MPVLPLGNISLGLALFYAALAAGWLLVTWREPRATLLFVVGPLLAPIAALGLLPLAAARTRSAPLRALAVAIGVLTAALAAGIRHVALPLVGGPAPLGIGVAGARDPFDVAGSLARAAGAHPSLLLETCALALVALALPHARARGRWAAAGLGAGMIVLTVAAVPSAAALPLLLAAWAIAAVTALRAPALGVPSRGGVMVLRGIEQRLERVFEGVFGRAFRTNVQPVELARKLAKEMDEHRSTSVTRVYVPNEYTIYLSPGDREQFEGYENSLVSELEEYLSEHASRENYAVLTPPRVLFETDEDLGMGEFGIATRMAQYGRQAGEEAPAEVPAPGATMVYKPRTQPTEAASLADLGVEREVAVLSWSGQRRVLEQQRSVLGRSRDVDVRIEDPNVSRRHAEIVQEGSTYWLVDLGSTNGTEVDGRRVQRVRLADGSSFTIGETTVTFSTERE